MEFNKIRVASLLLLLVVLASQEMLCRGDDRLCGTTSQLYRGLCSKPTCRAVCQEEGSTEGYCRMKWFFFLNRKCICQKPCGPEAQEFANGEPSDYTTNLRWTELGM